MSTFVCSFTLFRVIIASHTMVCKSLGTPVVVLQPSKFTLGVYTTHDHLGPDDDSVYQCGKISEPDPAIVGICAPCRPTGKHDKRAEHEVEVWQVLGQRRVFGRKEGGGSLALGAESGFGAGAGRLYETVEEWEAGVLRRLRVDEVKGC